MITEWLSDWRCVRNSECLQTRMPARSPATAAPPQDSIDNCSCGPFELVWRDPDEEQRKRRKEKQKQKALLIAQKHLEEIAKAKKDHQVKVRVGVKHHQSGLSGSSASSKSISNALKPPTLGAEDQLLIPSAMADSAAKELRRMKEEYEATYLALEHSLIMTEEEHVIHLELMRGESEDHFAGLENALARAEAERKAAVEAFNQADRMNAARVNGLSSQEAQLKALALQELQFCRAPAEQQMSSVCAEVQQVVQALRTQNESLRMRICKMAAYNASSASKRREWLRVKEQDVEKSKRTDTSVEGEKSRAELVALHKYMKGFGA